MLDDYFTLHDELPYSLFEGARYPWEPLAKLKPFLKAFFDTRQTKVPAKLEGKIVVKGLVYIEDGALIEEGVYIHGPTVIQKDAQVRFGAYIRGDALIGAGAIVGHDTEVKHAIFLPEAKAAHFAYVGDSILGRDVNLGAGTKLGNVKVTRDKINIRVRIGEASIDTGTRKLGAILGDGVSLGCNTVTSPGTLIGRDTLGYPLASLGGVYPPNTILQVKQQVRQVPRRD